MSCLDLLYNKAFANIQSKDYEEATDFLVRSNVLSGKIKARSLLLKRVNFLVPPNLLQKEIQISKSILETNFGQYVQILSEFNVILPSVAKYKRLSRFVLPSISTQFTYNPELTSSIDYMKGVLIFPCHHSPGWYTACLEYDGKAQKIVPYDGNFLRDSAVGLDNLYEEFTVNEVINNHVFVINDFKLFFTILVSSVKYYNQVPPVIYIVRSAVKKNRNRSIFLVGCRPRIPVFIISTRSDLNTPITDSVINNSIPRVEKLFFSENIVLPEDPVSSLLYILNNTETLSMAYNKSSSHSYKYTYKPMVVDGFNVYCQDRNFVIGNKVTDFPAVKVCRVVSTHTRIDTLSALLKLRFRKSIKFALAPVINQEKMVKIIVPNVSNMPRPFNRIFSRYIYELLDKSHLRQVFVRGLRCVEGMYGKCIQNGNGLFNSRIIKRSTFSRCVLPLPFAGKEILSKLSNDEWKVALVLITPILSVYFSIVPKFKWKIHRCAIDTCRNVLSKLHIACTTAEEFYGKFEELYRTILYENWPFICMNGTLEEISVLTVTNDIDDYTLTESNLIAINNANILASVIPLIMVCIRADRFPNSVSELKELSFDGQ